MSRKRSVKSTVYKKPPEPVQEEEQKGPKKVSLDDIRKRREALEKNVVMLSMGAYAKHKKARNIMASVVSKTSEQFFKKQISADEFFKRQEEGAKKAIRATNLFVAKRAWADLFEYLLAIPGREIWGVPIRFQSMANYWKQYGCRWMIVDMPDPPADPITNIAEEESTHERKEEEDSKSREASVGDDQSGADSGGGTGLGGEDPGEQVEGRVPGLLPSGGDRPEVDGGAVQEADRGTDAEAQDRIGH